MNNSENNNITSEWLKANTKITGWLMFFLVLPVGVGSARSFLYQIKEYNAEDYGNNLCLGSVDIFISLSFLGMAIFIIYSFLNRKRNAVFWAKAYIILSILLNSLNLILNMNADADFIGEKLKIDHENYRLICSIMWGVIWFLYLTFSKHVQEIIPKSFRKVSIVKRMMRVYGTGDSISCSTMKQANRVCYHPMMVENQLRMLMNY